MQKAQTKSCGSYTCGWSFYFMKLNHEKWNISWGIQKSVKIQYLLLPSPEIICNPHDKKRNSLCSYLALVFASWEWWRVEGSWDLLAMSLRWEWKAPIYTSNFLSTMRKKTGNVFWKSAVLGCLQSHKLEKSNPILGPSQKCRESTRICSKCSFVQFLSEWRVM